MHPGASNAFTTCISLKHRSNRWSISRCTLGDMFILTSFTTASLIGGVMRARLVTAYPAPFRHNVASIVPALLV